MTRLLPVNSCWHPRRDKARRWPFGDFAEPTHGREFQPFLVPFGDRCAEVRDLMPDIDAVLTMLPLPLLQHHFAESAATVENGVEVDVDDARPVFVRRICRRHVFADAGVVTSLQIV